MRMCPEMWLFDTQNETSNLRLLQQTEMTCPPVWSFLAWADWSFNYFPFNNSRAALIKHVLRTVLSLICFCSLPGSIRGSFSCVNQCACTAGLLPWPDNSAQVPHLSQFDLDTSHSIPPKESDRNTLFMQPWMVICSFKSLQQIW